MVLLLGWDLVGSLGRMVWLSNRIWVVKRATSPLQGDGSRLALDDTLGLYLRKGLGNNWRNEKTFGGIRCVLFYYRIMSKVLAMIACSNPVAYSL